MSGKETAIKVVVIIYLHKSLKYGKREECNLYSWAVGYFCSWLLGHSDVGQNASPTANSDEREPKAAKPFIAIAGLMGKPPSEFESRFGKPTSIVKTNDPGTTPGEIRDYKISDVDQPAVTDGGLMVTFYKGQSVLILADLPRPTSELEEAFAQVGIDITGKKPNINAPLAQGWDYFVLNDTPFKHITAQKAGSDMKIFTTIKAEISRESIK